MREISVVVPDRWMLLLGQDGNVRANGLLGLLQPASGPATAR